MTAIASRRAAPVSAADILERLEKVRRNGEGRWMARCPAHGDRMASLSIREGDDGRTLLHCFCGCEFKDIVAALDLEPHQLFPASERGWVPKRQRPDPERETWATFNRLRTIRQPPAPERMQRELEFIGRLILGGTGAMREVPASFGAESLRCFPLRIIFQAAQELAAEGTPRRWLSPLALARVVERAGAPEKRPEIFFWARMAVGAAGRSGR